MEAPSKPCHNCRRQRLRCDRSYPHCNKCKSLERECLGYGQLFRWTGAVASRGKLAGKTSSAPVPSANQGGDVVMFNATNGQDSSSSSSSSNGSSSPSSSTSSNLDTQLVWKRPWSVASTTPSSPYVLVDPLYQDLGDSHRYYLSYCK